MSRSAMTIARMKLRQHVRYVAGVGRHPPGLGRVGQRPGRRQGGQLAHPPRVRVGKPGLEALDSVLLGTCRFVRYDERGCGMSEWQGGALNAGSMGCGSRGGHRRRRARRAGDAARHLAGRGDLHPLCGSPSGARRAADPVRRLRPRRATSAGRPPPRRRSAPWSSWRAWPGASDNPTFRQVFTSRFIPGGTHEQLEWFNDLCLKTTTGEVAAALLEARGDMDIEALLPQGAHADAGSARAERRGRADRRRTSPGQRHPGRRVRRARFAQPHPARARASLAAVPRSGACVPRAEGRAPPIRCSRRCRRASVRCWR